MMTFRVDLVDNDQQIVASFTWETDQYPNAALDDWAQSQSFVMPGSIAQRPLLVRVRRIL